MGYDTFLSGGEDAAFNTNSGWLRQSMYTKNSDDCAETTLFEQYVNNPQVSSLTKEKKK